MEPMSYKLTIVLILTVGFFFASILGYISNRLKLSPILGYLIAGYLIGPYSPGYVADLHVAEQLAEIGVILMLFSVGLHFRVEDLIKVKNVAIPGAIGQTAAATILTALFLVYSGWTVEASIIVGLCLGVASTVVLVRVLEDNQLLKTEEGHVAIGWLIVEDIFTVLALVLIPVLTYSGNGNESPPTFLTILGAIFWSLIKFLLMVVILFSIGRKFVRFALTKIYSTASNELFTLTILALTFVIAIGSSYIFGTSIALGAFIAGMIIGMTDVRHKVSTNSTPLKDTFVVIFFISAGMLFNPLAIIHNLYLFFVALAIILIVKPLTAFIIVKVMNHPTKTALTVAIALAQIGEFSFILAEEATRLDLMPDEGFDIIVACSLISISLNPLLFKFLPEKEISNTEIGTNTEIGNKEIAAKDKINKHK